MKNRPFSLIVIALGLASWLVQVIISAPLTFPTHSGREFWVASLFELLPYVLVCCVAASVSIPQFGNWLLGAATVLIGGIGVSAWIDYATGGGCMRGLALSIGYFAQCIIAVAGVLLALIAKAVAHFRLRHSR